jgi:hypothetical protein
MPVAGNTTSSGSGGVYSSNKRGITPVMGALSQRSSMAGGSAMQHNKRGSTLAVLLQSNDNMGGGEGA